MGAELDISSVFNSFFELIASLIKNDLVNLIIPLVAYLVIAILGCFHYLFFWLNIIVDAVWIRFIADRARGNRALSIFGCAGALFSGAGVGAMLVSAFLYSFLNPFLYALAAPIFIAVFCFGACYGADIGSAFSRAFSLYSFKGYLFAVLLCILGYICGLFIFSGATMAAMAVVCFVAASEAGSAAPISGGNDYGNTYGNDYGNVETYAPPEYAAPEYAGIPAQ